jgi:zinc D-Ala-D-Ala dipeptidase
MVDVRVAAPRVRIPYERTIPFLRLKVALMLDEASRALPEGVFLAATDVWRPLERQRRIYEFMSRCAAEAHPERTGASLIRTVNRFVAPPDRPAPPGHCTGAAVDVMLVNESGEDLDVCAPFSRFLAAPTYTIGLTPEAQRHRDLLANAMLGAGFSNCRDEWWHYSYGDAGWAVRMGLSECCYGVANLPEEHYARQEELWLEAIKDRPNPFLEGRA